MPDFFHVSKDLRVGEVVAPGKWGHEALAFGTRGRRGIQEESDAVNLIQEGALEAARLARFPDAVSRLDCVFAWFREEEARAFRDRFRRIIKSIEWNSLILTHPSPSRTTGQ
jgi:hypothetical protein